MLPFPGASLSCRLRVYYKINIVDSANVYHTFSKRLLMVSIKHKRLVGSAWTRCGKFTVSPNFLPGFRNRGMGWKEAVDG